MAAFCCLHRCDIFITRAHEFYLAREQNAVDFMGISAQRHQIFGLWSKTIRPRRSKRNCVHNALPANNPN